MGYLRCLPLHKEHPPPKSKNYAWSKMLDKTFKIDVTKCQVCHGDLRKIGAVVDGGAVQRYLKIVGLDHWASPR